MIFNGFIEKLQCEITSFPQINKDDREKRVRRRERWKERYREGGRDKSRRCKGYIERERKGEA